MNRSLRMFTSVRLFPRNTLILNAHVDEEVFYFRHRSNRPSMEEHRAAQPASGYPI